MTLDDGYVPEALFGRDHFSTLAYLETVMVDCGGFQIGADARMRSGRANFRVLLEQCPRPIRANSAPQGVVMDRAGGSRLNDGTIVTQHDDWHCIQDMAEAGYFMTGKRQKPGKLVAAAADIQPKVWLHLSARGREVVNALRDFKASGRAYAEFAAPAAVV